MRRGFVALLFATLTSASSARRRGLPGRTTGTGLENWFSAGNSNRRSRNIARKRIGQHHKGRRQLGGLPRPFHWYLFAEIDHRVLGKRRGNERRPDRAGRYRVCPNALLSQ